MHRANDESLLCLPSAVVRPMSSGAPLPWPKADNDGDASALVNEIHIRQAFGILGKLASFEKPSGCSLNGKYVSHRS